MPWDQRLWWLMVATGILAAGVSVIATLLDRRESAWPSRHQRFLLHIAGYSLMSLSILSFAVRGLLNP
ncbi:hypothetical protein [Pseudorhodoplanes sp.]|uniref:hypothetical protein n=1 Tax=Pseudorhodoplanes sp. TaxID=1934341 RepID=UPI003D14C3D9